MLGGSKIDMKKRNLSHLPWQVRLRLLTDYSGLLTDCWPYANAKPGSYSGYGFIMIDGKQEAAHRMSWIMTNGPIPPDKPHILHSCDNPACVNPNHLRAGTNAENNEDKAKRNRVWNKKLDSCHRGHPRTPENYVAYPGRPTVKVCKPCLNEKSLERYYALKGTE